MLHGEGFAFALQHPREMTFYFVARGAACLAMAIVWSTVPRYAKPGKNPSMKTR